MTDKNKFLFIPALALAGVIYSALFPVNRMSVEYGLPYIGYVFWFSLLATLVLLAVTAYKRELQPLTWLHIRAYLVLGIMAVALPVPLLTFLAPKLPVGIITLLLVLVPLLTYAMSYFLRLEKFRISGMLGVLLGLGGMLFVLIPQAGLPTPDMVWWVILAMVGPLCFAACNAFVIILRPPGTPSMMMAAGMSSGATILLAPVMLLTDQAFVFPTASLDANLVILYAAAITAAVTVAWFYLVRITGPVFFSQFNYFIVLGGFGWGYILNDERHSFYVWIATAMAFAGLAIFTHGTRGTVEKVEEAPAAAE
ncbi:MAG: DMT family transporter [Proteobacteria bacterium]|nr:DMT family transporter [Pseudomonadota bacterium]MDA1357695.1 DMT family transporter [Pseudomonadota bacterium]